MDNGKSSEIWGDDRLGRAEDADYIITFLTRRLAERSEAGLSTSYVLNINAPWGTGKTFLCSAWRPNYLPEEALWLRWMLGPQTTLTTLCWRSWQR